MKINILPNNSKKKRAPEPAPVFKPYYTGSSKTLAFLGNNLLYLISFLFPVVVLFTLMAVNGFAPFGDKNLFILDGSVYNLPHFATFVEQLHSGNFSFFMEGGVLGKEYFSTIVFYLTSPLHLLLCFFSQETAIVLLAVVTVLQIGFAGFAMTFYLTHRLQGYRYSKYDYSVLLFSFAFSLSGYFLIQYNDFMYLDCVVLFPLLFLALEYLLYKDTYKYFYGLLAFCFFCNFYMAAIIFVLLFFYVLTRKKGDFSNSVTKCIQYLLTGIGAALTSAITVFPGFYSLYQTQIKTSSAPDFSFITDWLSFYGSLMPKNFGSYASVLSYGNNIYCGLLSIILLMFYLFTKSSTLKNKNKFRNIIYLIFLIFIANISSMQYAFHIFSMPTTSFNCFSFILSFFIIILSSESLYEIRQLSAIQFSVGMITPIVLLISASLWSLYYSSSKSISFALIMFTMYFLSIILYKRGSVQRNSLRVLFLLFLLVELTVNAKQTFTYLAIDSDKIDSSLVSVENSGPYVKNPFDIDMESSSLVLPNAFLRSQDCTYTQNTYNTEFEAQNSIARSLGSSTDIFTPANISVTSTQTKDIQVELSSNNILNINVSADSSKAKNPYSTLPLIITPKQNGDLYLCLNQPVHIGTVTANTPVKYKFLFETAPGVWDNYWIRAAFLDHTVLENLQANILNNTVAVKNTLSTISASINTDTNSNLIFNAPYSPFVAAYIDGHKQSITPYVGNTISISVSSGTHDIVLKYNYLPVTIGIFISILCFVCITTRKHFCIPNIMEKYSFKNSLNKIYFTIKSYPVALLSFFIPFCILVLLCIINGCAPFGPNSFIHGDGIAGYIPSIYQMQYQSSHNSFLYSWISGGGNNFYYSAPYTILYYWTRFINQNALLSVFTMIEILSISFGGLSMYFYLTKRRIGHKLHKSDYRLLIFTSVYTLNAYMLNYRNNLFWMVVLGLLPLLLLALDRLMLDNKKIPYILLLGFSILCSFNMAFFVCIFLAFTFFTYSFDSIKDFLRKGIRFAYSSLLSAGIVFFGLGATYLGFQSTGYSEADSIFPSFTFYQSYFDTLKQIFIFSDRVTVTEDNGAVNVYCSIFIVLMFLLAITIKHSKQIYIKMFFLAFVFFSSNNNMMSYFWNGLHYQTKVPNRYAFIMILLLIDIAIETLYKLSHLTKLRIVLLCILSFLFCVCTIHFSTKEVSDTSAVTTTVFIICYIILFILLSFQKHKHLWKTVLTTIVLLELTINASYTILHEEDLGANSISYYDTAINHYKKNICTNTLETRLNFVGETLNNLPMISGINSIKYFNSLLTPYYSTIGAAYGFRYSSNVLDSTANLNPLANAILNTGYVLLDGYTKTTLSDFDSYTPIACIDRNIILKNERTLSLGYYMPSDNIARIRNEKVMQTEYYANNIAHAFTNKNIFTDLYLTSDPYSVAKNSGIMSYDSSDIITTKVFYKTENEKCQRLYITPQKSGTYYFRSSEFFYLGELDAGGHYQFDIPCDDPNGVGFLSIFHEDAFEEFYESASRYTMDISEFEDTSVRGTITLPEEGYIYMSIPYERGWSATVDGKDAIVETAPDGLTMIKASAGTHEVHLTFRPYGLTACIIGTLIAWIIFLFTIVFEKRHNKRMRLKAAAADTTLPPAHLRSHQQAEEPHCELPQACSSAPQAPQEGSLPDTACYTDTLSDRSGGQAPDSIADTSAASEMKTQG